MRVVKHLRLTKQPWLQHSSKEDRPLILRRRLLYLLPDRLFFGLFLFVALLFFRFLLFKVSTIRGKANMGQSQCLALTEHKCFTSGLNYQRITESVAPCHCASHTGFKQVENLFKAVVSNQPLLALAKKTHLSAMWDQIHEALVNRCMWEFEGSRSGFWLSSYLKYWEWFFLNRKWSIWPVLRTNSQTVVIF